MHKVSQRNVSQAISAMPFTAWSTFLYVIIKDLKLVRFMVSSNSLYQKGPRLMMSILKTPEKAISLPNGSKIEVLHGYLLCCFFVVFVPGFPGKECTCNTGDLGSIPEMERCPKRREWQPTLVFLPGEFHGQTDHGVAKSWTEQLKLSLLFQKAF